MPYNLAVNDVMMDTKSCIKSFVSVSIGFKISIFLPCINNNFSEEYPGIRLKHRKVIVVDFKRFLFGIKRIDIFLVDDEYFIVDVFETGDKSVFYKCDQIDGLIQLLNDLKTFRTNTYSLDESLDTQESLVRRVEIDPRL